MDDVCSLPDCLVHDSNPLIPSGFLWVRGKVHPGMSSVIHKATQRLTCMHTLTPNDHLETPKKPDSWFWTVGGSRRTQREPTLGEGEPKTSMQRTWEANLNLLVGRQQCSKLHHHPIHPVYRDPEHRCINNFVCLFILVKSNRLIYPYIKGSSISGHFLNCFLRCFIPVTLFMINNTVFGIVITSVENSDMVSLLRARNKKKLISCYGSYFVCFVFLIKRIKYQR